MRTFATQSIRELLKINADGMDVGTIANTLNREPENVRRILKTMPDAYIDRWTRFGGIGRPSAIWCVVIPPENCPPPDAKRKRKTR
jgi:queuine/archaeosine tRNA-ribosyltransferase